MPDTSISRKRVGELMWNLASALSRTPDGLRAKDAIERLGELVPPTQYESETYESGGVRFDKVIRFATIDLVKAGWLVKDAGIWSITEEGKAALVRYANPDDFYRESIRLYREWKRKSSSQENKDSETNPIELDSPEASSQVLLDEVKDEASQAIFEYLAAINPYDFQSLVAHLLRGMGHYVDFEAKPGRDGGLDIIAYSHVLGTDGQPRVKVQVKSRETSKADAKELREFNSLLNGSDVGIFVSLAGFTSEAEREVRAMHDKRILLVDFTRLMELWIANFHSISEAGKRILPLTAIHFLDLQGS